MSVLEQTHISSDQDPPIGIGKGTVFYVYYGRNAWHSTWITRYSHGALHDTLETAKAHCETRRVQGSVFNILELPALILLTQQRVVYITEINSENPLRGYAGRYIDKKWALITGNQHHPKKIRMDMPMHNIEDSFRPLSNYWTHQPNFQNSVMVVQRHHQGSMPELKNRVPSKREHYVSHSYGKEYALGWRRQSNNIKTSGIALAYAKLTQS